MEKEEERPVDTKKKKRTIQKAKGKRLETGKDGLHLARRKTKTTHRYVRKKRPAFQGGKRQRLATQSETKTDKLSLP